MYAKQKKFKKSIEDSIRYKTNVDSNMNVDTMQY